MLYIYIHTQNSFFGRSEKERFLDRFRKGFWIGFGEVFGLILERFLERFWKGFGEVFRYDFRYLIILLCISCWKGFGKGFRKILDRC